MPNSPVSDVFKLRVSRRTWRGTVGHVTDDRH